MATLPPPLAALERRLGVAEGTLTGTDLARAEEALADATALALAEVSPSTATAWSEPDSAPAVVVTVVLKAARREYENPQGYTQETVGDYAYSTNASGVYFTDAEVALIHRAAGPSGRRSRAALGSVAVTSPFENV